MSKETGKVISVANDLMEISASAFRVVTSELPFIYQEEFDESQQEWHKRPNQSTETAKMVQSLFKSSEQIVLHCTQHVIELSSLILSFYQVDKINDSTLLDWSHGFYNITKFSSFNRYLESHKVIDFIVKFIANGN